jgi:hypothetical protein
VSGSTFARTGEVIVPLPGPRERIPATKQVRSTLIASSQRAVRDRGRFDEYLKLVDSRWREPLTIAVAGTWLPIDAAMAHYRACDGLLFSLAEQQQIGREVGDRLHGTFLGTIIRSAKTVGVSPWTPLANAQKLYARVFDGGAVSVLRVGPKEADIEMVRNALLGVGYFRNALRSLWQVAMEFFCTRVYVRETTRTDDSACVRVAWA